MHARQAAVFAAVEATGLSKSDIGRIAGVHRSQVSRWVSGEQRPSYERTMRLAAHLKARHPGLAEELIEAAGYGEPVEQGPDSTIDGDVLAALRRAYRGEPGKLAEAIKAIEEVDALTTAQPAAAPSRPERRAG